MKRKFARRVRRGKDAEVPGKVHASLVDLCDDLADTAALTAFLCDGICGITADDSAAVDLTTHKGIFLASRSLRQRHRTHVAQIQALCDMLQKSRKC
jgi:hypothetical protein